MAVGVWGALLFNVCLLLLPLAGAAAFLMVTRDGLYSYEQSDGITRQIRQRVERLSGELILLDFDRRRQWDDLVALELMDGDIAAARGFLLSARQMLSPRDATDLNRRLNGIENDAAIELAALDLLTPGTRTRYVETVPLLSRRSASGASLHRQDASIDALGDARDFELLAAAMLDDAEADPFQFVLLGLALDLGGELTEEAKLGAATLAMAARRPDFPARLREDFVSAFSAAAPLPAFRAEAAARAQDGANAASYPIAAAAFRAAINEGAVIAITERFTEIGAISTATSSVGAAQMLLHARSINDIPRLRQVAHTAGDRAVAVAKRLERDGRLAQSAHGSLKFNRDLIAALVVAALAAIGLAVPACAECWATLRANLVSFKGRRSNPESAPAPARAPPAEEEDLVQSFDTPWRVL